MSQQGTEQRLRRTLAAVSTARRTMTAALDRRDDLIRELSGYGVSDRYIADLVDLSPVMVGKILGREVADR